MKLQRILSIATLFVATAVMSAQSMPSMPATPKSATAVTSAAGSMNAGALLDINSASPDLLKKLPGIGDAYSKRIVDGRPYAAKTQLLSRGILPKPTYDAIASKIIAKQAK
jgi:competence protein ComEA